MNPLEPACRTGIDMVEIIKAVDDAQVEGGYQRSAGRLGRRWAASRKSVAMGERALVGMSGHRFQRREEQLGSNESILRCQNRRGNGKDPPRHCTVANPTEPCPLTNV